ncbi:single-stranded DNA-binding protein [Candidatus Saccharibacteria bacterium]|nr:single-stranded DNA-binding protein [Candidatus Saccharibacteria bacterium]MBR2864548.1 single-stranded DNA-binding protein [Candidatus Saccharibacteria bacterium]MBR3233881.1 single-stranded DNA-binding protein [Candidatus Saccharibacteria bacterium]
MARGFSKVVICGNLTRDPEMRATPSGAQVASFSVAVNRVYKDANGSQKEAVSFFNCSAWGKLGETIAQYAKKGNGILLSGRLDQRSWDDKTSGQKRSAVEIVVEDFNFIGGGDNSYSGDDSGSSKKSKSSAKSSKSEDAGVSEEVIPDDIPADDEGEVSLDEIPF